MSNKGGIMVPFSIEQMCSRALQGVFSKKSLITIFPALLLSAIISSALFSFGKAVGGWLYLVSLFLPIFLSIGFILLGYIAFIQLSRRSFQQSIIEIKKLGQLLLFLGSPLAIVYGALWLLLGVFYLIKLIPGIGSFLGALLSFAPFLLVLVQLVLALANTLLLFVVAPLVLRKLSPYQLLDMLYEKLTTRLVLHIALFLIGLLPLLGSITLLLITAFITTTGFDLSAGFFVSSLQTLVILVPLALFLTPPMVFFLNMAGEADAIVQKKYE